MNKKILLFSILTLFIIFSATFVLSNMINEGNKESSKKEFELNVYKKNYKPKECTSICSWCYVTYYSCDSNGMCC